MSAAGAAPGPAWNLLATSLEGQREALLRVLRPLGRWRRGGYPNVLLGTVETPLAFLDALRDAYEASAALRAALGKVVPMDCTLRFASAPAFVAAVTDVLAPRLERLAAASFFVRVSRRGFRGALDSTAAEREVGAWLVHALEARGGRPRVTFDDPDVIVAIETVRDEAGVALLPRALRRAYPFVRIR